MTIDSAIDALSGYIVATVADQLKRPVEGVSEAFFHSDTYALLSDKDTGYYWDTLSELIDKFIRELGANSQVDSRNK